MAPRIPARLAASCGKSPERLAWLAGVPAALGDLERQWSIRLGDPFDTEEVSCAWVAPATLADGTTAILKLGMPHLEAEHELEGLRFWNGDPTVKLLRADGRTRAMLLERCQPGTYLRALPEFEQDVLIGGLLRRLWREPSAPHPFRPLSVLMECWSQETLADRERWPDPGLVRAGLGLLEELPRSAKSNVLLATDLHAGNILSAQREPWLVIDPKPFVGDPAYDVTQHLINCIERLGRDPQGLIRRMTDLAGADCERVRLWTFARAAAEPRSEWRNDEWLAIARALSR